MPAQTTTARLTAVGLHAIAVLCIALPPVLTAAATHAATEATPESDEAVLDRAHAERLRRAIEKYETEQTETKRRRDDEFGRQAGLTRLQARLSVLDREESTLQGRMRQTETQLVYMHRDPADISAHARRSELQSRVSYYRSQINQITAEKQIALRQLSELRDLRQLRFR